MDSICSHIFCCSNDPVHVQVAVSGRTFSDTDTLVCQLYMKALGIFLRINSYTSDPQIPAGTYDPNCNLPTVGDQNFIKQYESLLILQSLNAEQRLSVFYFLFIAYQNCFYLTVIVTLDLIHKLHSFQNADCLSCLYLISHLYKGRYIRSSC